MNFQVPQFIEIEDKIFGPLTFRQFVFIAGGVGLGYIFFAMDRLPLFLRLIPALASVALGLAFAFYKINNRPFIFAVEAAFRYLTSSKLYLWKKAPNPSKPTAPPVASISAQPTVPKLSHSRLQDLTWSLDINEKIN